jgi:hypothetical protein
MHLSRRPKVVFTAEHTLRPGDGERSINREGNHPNRACINDLNPLGAVHSYSLQHLLHTYS